MFNGSCTEHKEDGCKTKIKKEMQKTLLYYKNLHLMAYQGHIQIYIFCLLYENKLIKLIQTEHIIYAKQKTHKKDNIF